MNEFELIWGALCITTLCIVVSILYILHLNRMRVVYRNAILLYQDTIDKLLEDKRKYNKPGRVRDQWGRYMTLGQPLKPFKVGIKGKHGKFISQSKLTLLRNRQYD